MEEGQQQQQQGTKKRKRRDAFEVMMSASKKMYRKRNAFEVMMEASVAGAFNQPVKNWLDQLPKPSRGPACRLAVEA